MSKPSCPQPSRRRVLLGGAAAVGLWGTVGAAGCFLARQAAAAEVGLDRFMALSQALTGRDDLQSGIGEVYLTALLRSPENAAALEALLAGNGAPAADLEKEILDQWYSGVYRAGGLALTATYQGALMWQAMSFTEPPGRCNGELGFWSEPPADQD